MGAEGPILCRGRGERSLTPPVCRSDRNDDLTDLVVRFEEAVSVLDGVERESARDPRLELARFQTRHDERLGAIEGGIVRDDLAVEIPLEREALAARRTTGTASVRR